MATLATADDPATGSFPTDKLVDVSAYPINKRGSKAYLEVVNSAQEGLQNHSCALLKNFFREEIVSQMAGEAASLAPGAVYVEKAYNPYFDEVPDDLPEDHPRRRVTRRTNGMVRADHFNRGGAIWALFKNYELLKFVADCLGKNKLHTYRDPFGCMNLNIQIPGSEFAWHFDNNEFTVSLILQHPQAGGEFEYVPDLRTEEDPGFDAVRKVLDGDRSLVRPLDLQPGDLQLFKGRYALHRVTAPRGKTGRISLLLGYSEDREAMASPTFSQNLWGEVHPLQVEAFKRRSLHETS